MEQYKATNPIVIGVDHGYGNIKTAHSCFKTGVTAYDTEPTFKGNLLTYNGRFYQIGEEHKEFVSEKMRDDDYYILTLAAIARELDFRKTNRAAVHLAAGLPLTWVGEQKEAFKAYLLRNSTADYIYRGHEYHVEFAGADVFPQGFAAVAGQLRDFTGVNMLCDIGNGTMNVMYINDCRPLEQKCFTEKFGTHQCMLAASERVTRLFGTVIDESTIERVLRYGSADVGEKYLNAIREAAVEYVQGIFRKLREREYHPDLMRLVVVGGGSCLVKNFGQYDEKRVAILTDICATAKGYEMLAEHKLRRNGGMV